MFYSLPCLTGILNNEALIHYSLLVKSLYTLLKTEISNEELVECEQNLLEFLGLFEIYYGSEAITFNVHSLLHVVESVKKNGPLWAKLSISF